MGAFDDLMAKRLGGQTTEEEEDKKKKPAESQLERLAREVNLSAPVVPNTEEQSIGGRMLRAGQRGVAALGEAAEGVGLFAKSTVGADESAQRTVEFMRADQEAQAAQPQPLSAKQLGEIYDTAGLGSWLANVPTYVGEQIAQNAPTMAVPLSIGAGVTKATHSPKAGAVAGVLTYALQSLGNNMLRQVQEGKDAPDLKPGKAAAAAAITAPIGYFTDKFVMGLGNLGTKPAIALVTAELAARSAGKTIFKGALKGLAEIPTEILEQMGERYQADLDLFSDDAMAEYKEAAAGAAAVGTVGGALGSLPERNAARKAMRQQAIEERKAKLQEAADNREILTKNLANPMGPPTQQDAADILVGQRSLWESEQAPPQMPDMPTGPGEQLELPFGQPEPPAPPTPPPAPPAPSAPPAAPVEPVPAATVGPELTKPIAPGAMSALIEKMRAAKAKMEEISTTFAPTSTTPAVLDVPKEKPSKVKLDVQPHVFTEEGEPVETTGKPKSFGVSNPEVFPPSDLIRPAVLLRDGSVIEGPKQHMPIRPNAPNAEKEATAASIVEAQTALQRKMRDMGVTRGEIAFHRIGEEDRSPAFGWVVDTPESKKTGVPTFVSRQEYENAKNLSDKVMAPAFKNKTDDADRVATAEAKAKETADKFGAVDAPAVEDMVKKHVKLVGAVAARAERSIGFSRPSFSKDEIKSAVGAATARVAAETDLATKGMSPEKKAAEFKKNLKKIKGLALNTVEESQGKRRAVEAQMKEGTLNPLSLDQGTGGAEGTGALVDTLVSDGTSTAPAPKVAMVPAAAEVLPKPVRKVPISKAQGPTTRTLDVKEKAKYQKRLDKLVNQYNGYAAKHPEMTQEQIFDHFKSNPDPAFRWGDKSVADYKAEAARRKSTPSAPQGTVEPQGKEIVPKATTTIPKVEIVEPAASPAVPKAAKAAKPAPAPKLTGGVGDIDTILAAVDAKTKPIGTSIADLKVMRAAATPQANTKVRAAKAQVADRLARMKELAKEANKVLGEEGGSEGSIQMDKLKPIFKEMYNESKALGMDVATFVAEVSKMVGEKTMGAFRQWVDTDLRAELTAPKTSTASELLAKMRKKQEKPAVTGTKVVDATGKPMKMYHASSTPIREFKSGKQVSWYSRPMKGEFGENVVEAHLDIKNPAPSLNEWNTNPDKYDGLFYAAEDYEGKPGFLARVKDPSQIKILNKPADTKADKMVRPRLTGKTAAREADVQSVFADMVASSGIAAPELQQKLIKYGTDTNSLVVKKDGNAIFEGYKGIEFGKLRDPNIADGLIVPVGTNQYVVFKPEVPGQTPYFLEIVENTMLHVPFPEDVAPVSKQAAPLGSKVPAGPTAADLMGKPKKELTEEEYLATLPPDEAQKMRDAIHAPTPEPKAEPKRSPALVEHLAATARIVVPSKQGAFKRYLAENRVPIYRSAWAQTAFTIKGKDADVVVEVGPNEFLTVGPEVLEAFRTGTKPPKSQVTTAQKLAEDAEVTRKNVAKYGVRAPAAVDYSKAPAAQKADLSRFALGDVVPAQHTTMFEATFISGENTVIEVVGTKKDAKTEFLQKVRDKGKDLKATRVVVTQAVGGKPSLEHQVIRHSDMNITPQKVSDLIANERGSAQFLTDVAGFVMTMPNQIKDGLRDMWHGFADYHDVEAPWKRQHMGEIGFTIKNWFSRRDKEERLGMEQAQTLQMATARRFGGKVTKDDMLNIVLATENSGKIWDGEKLVTGRMDDAWLKKAQPTIDWLNNHFKETQVDFKRRGVELDFIGNQIARLQEKIRESKDESKVADYQELIDKMRTMQFVHIPYRMLFNKKIKEYITTNSASEARRKMQQLRTIINRHRDSPTLAKLLEPLEDGTTIINPHDVNPAMVIMNYAYNKGLEHAMLDIRDAVESYGDKVVQIATKKPKDAGDTTWQKNPATTKIFDTLIPKDKRSTHDVYVRTDLIKALQNSMSFSNAVGRMRTTLAWIKMAAFFNPVMMPMYNTYQLAMGGLWNPRHWNLVKSYEDIGGWKSFFGREYGTRSEDYWKAMEEGAASQPFSNPYADIEAMTKGVAAQKGNPMTDWVHGVLNSYISRVATDFRDSSLPMKPIAPLKAAMAMFYSGINTMTWVGDEYTRMIAYNYLRDKGHSTRNAAQLTAMMLGDYASVPAKTRQLYNMIMFTPTYKISMMKFWGKMAQAVTNPKVMGSFIGKNPKYKVDRRYIYSILGSAAISGAIRAGFENMGWEEDEFLRKWTRQIITKEGRKELVTTLSTPLNIVWKYGSLFKKIIMGDPGNMDSALVRISRAAEMELHPLWKAMIQASRNQNIGGETIIHPFDPPEQKIKHIMSFGIETLSPVVNFMYGKINNDIPWEGKSQKLARDAYRKEAGPFMDAMLDILAFKYVRDVPEIRRSKELKRLASELPKELVREKKENGTIRRDWIENYKQRSAEVVLRMRKGK